ncbi:hypothetical protein [Clostridium sp. K25]|uniref:hypothetical protein n=1 Tax=Clostridium sp. K25 TaxID=1443109 RepID=UPI00057E7969|nr:hypothetical protein [Clostridium sp. K25]
MKKELTLQQMLDELADSTGVIYARIDEPVEKEIGYFWLNNDGVLMYSGTLERALHKKGNEYRFYATNDKYIKATKAIYPVSFSEAADKLLYEGKTIYCMLPSNLTGSPITKEFTPLNTDIPLDCFKTDVKWYVE